ncbi:MAG TPA: RNA polymerase sigma factor [Clostridiaceae bacterium]|nr:RNA polymerase sigma factor [Clostridiaceae bacterium]
MNKDQMEILYDKYHREVYLYAFSLCRNHHMAEDLMSDTFYKAFLSLEKGSSMKYWLFRVCKNLYLDFLKKKREVPSDGNLEKLLPHGENPLEKIITRDNEQQLYRALLALRASYQEVLVLYYFWGFSVAEIEVATEMKKSAVKTTLFRARKELRAVMEGENGL